MANLLYKCTVLVALLLPVVAIAEPLSHIEQLNADVYGVELTIREYAKSVALDHGLNVEKFLEVIHCESGWQADVQSRHRYTKDNPEWGVLAGDQELSFGIVQIHLPSHPTITKEQAKNPQWAINWMADRWVEGKQSWWSCY